MSWRHESRRRTTLIGVGALDLLDGELTSLGVGRVVLITTSRSSTSNVAKIVRHRVGQRLVAEFDAVRPHAPIDDIASAFKLARDAHVDCIVALGGGSASDASKAVALLMGGVDIAEFAGMHSTFESQIPIVALPTTLSGAETTVGGMFLENGRKRGFGAEGLRSRLIIHDPVQLSDIPVAIVASSGMNALAHCLEGLVCRAANPLTDALALEGAEKLVVGLVRLSRGDTSTDVITLLQVGASLGGVTLDTSMVGVHHALCHALGSTGLAHGDSNSVILPYALAYNQPAAVAEQGRAADRIGPALAKLGVSTALDLASQVADLQTAIGVPQCLSGLGIEREALVSVAEEAYDEVVATGQNPRTPESSYELLTLLNQAYDKGRV